MGFRIIVAYSEPEGGIGYEGALPWHIPADFQHFKRHTEGNVVIMGRNTWNSIPCRPLRNRINIVVTHKEKMDTPEQPHHVAACLGDALACAYQYQGTSTFVIGGQRLYEEAILHLDCDHVSATLVTMGHPQLFDRHFPLAYLHRYFTCVSREPPHTFRGITYTFCEFTKASLATSP